MTQQPPPDRYPFTPQASLFPEHPTNLPAGINPTPPQRKRNARVEGFAALFLIVFIMWMTTGTPVSDLEFGILIVVGLGIAFVFLVLRALYRIGSPREPAVTFTTPPIPQGPPAGWYHDPQGVVRWHDGTQWTDVLYPNP